MGGERDWPSVLVTGGEGRIGRVLAAGWRGRFESFDLPDGDALDRESLTDAARGHDALVHLAWDPAEQAQNSGFVPDNVAMAMNAIEAAAAAGVPRVVLASSVHATGYWPPPREPIDPRGTPVPDSRYGVSKVFMEALGRYAAAHRGLEVVAVRFGGVNPMDGEPEDPAERSVWLRHGDCVSLVQAAAGGALPPERFALVVGVSESPFRIHLPGNELEWPRAGVHRGRSYVARERASDVRLGLRLAAKALLRGRRYK